MNIKLLSNEEAARHWGTVEPMVAQALAHGEGAWTPHGLLLECLSSNAQCWVLMDDEDVIHGASITKYIRNNSFKELCIVTGTAPGFFKEFGIEILETFEDFARQSGCEYVSIAGRKGWQKFLPEEYKTPYTVYMRRL